MIRWRIIICVICKDLIKSISVMSYLLYIYCIMYESYSTSNLREMIVNGYGGGGRVSRQQFDSICSELRRRWYYWSWVWGWCWVLFLPSDTSKTGDSDKIKSWYKWGWCYSSFPLSDKCAKKEETVCKEQPRQPKRGDMVQARDYEDGSRFDREYLFTKEWSNFPFVCSDVGQEKEQELWNSFKVFPFKYIRQKPIEEIEEMTLSQVCEKLGKNIKIVSE